LEVGQLHEQEGQVGPEVPAPVGNERRKQRLVLLGAVGVGFALVSDAESCRDEGRAEGRVSSGIFLTKMSTFYVHG